MGVLTKQEELVGSFTLKGGNHRHAFYGSDDWAGGVDVDAEGNGQFSGITYYTEYSGDLTFSRPQNYTVRIWKRTA